MKKKWIGIMAALALVVAAPAQVQAEEFSGGDDWNVTFDGEKLNSTFKNADIDDAIYQLQILFIIQITKDMIPCPNVHLIN